MEDSAGKAGRAQQNRIEIEDNPSLSRAGDSQFSLCFHASEGLHRETASSPLLAEFKDRTELLSTSPPDPPEYRLPQRYNETILTLMARDPYWVYAYWSISEHDRHRICTDHGQEAWRMGVKLLRVYDVTGSDLDHPHSRMDIGIGDEATSWYINVPAPDRTYCAEIVVITPSGRELVLARSNPVSTPRDGVSDVIDEEWMTLAGFDKLYWMCAGFGPSSPEFQMRFESRLARRRLLMGSEALAMGFSPLGQWGRPSRQRIRG